MYTLLFLFIYPLVLNKLKKEIKTWKKTKQYIIEINIHIRFCKEKVKNEPIKSLRNYVFIEYSETFICICIVKINNIIVLLIVPEWKTFNCSVNC